MKKTLFLSAIPILLFPPTILSPDVWIADSTHARLGFSVTHLMVSEIDGSFSKFNATLTSSEADFSDAVVDLSADVSSINTDNEKRDAHLKTPDFFDAVKYPTLDFKSTSFIKSGEASYKVTGNLTMHGITKAVVLTATYLTGTNPITKKSIAGFKISGKLNRTDFGIGTTFASGMIGEDISIHANAEFIKNDVAD